MTDEYLSREKFRELEKELEYIKTVRRKEIAESLESARALGDLKENAEYHEARDTQAEAEDRILKIEGILKNAKIVSGKTGKKSDTVGLGSTVMIQKKSDKEKKDYKIVGSEEANVSERKISHVSPLGEAMLGKKKGDKFSLNTPNGKIEYKIVDVE